MYCNMYKFQVNCQIVLVIVYQDRQADRQIDIIIHSIVAVDKPQL